VLRLPPFTYQAPDTLAEAARVLAGEGPNAMLLAGGTDLIPKMKRRQITPRVLVGLRKIGELAHVAGTPERGLAIGAGVSLTAIEMHAAIGAAYPAIREAASVISTPQLRNAGTIGGNLCVDTRCTYYDQTFPWRKSIGFCLKKDGDTCWVAPGSPKCLAVTSSDLAPVMIALDASIELVGPHGDRRIPAAAMYQDDGIAYLAKRPDECIRRIILPPATGWRSTYLKVRRREAFDFPILGVALALRMDRGAIAEVRLAIGGVGSAPRAIAGAGELLNGHVPTAARYADVGQLAYKATKSMDNTDLLPLYRKRLVPVLVQRALAALAPLA